MSRPQRALHGSILHHCPYFDGTSPVGVFKEVSRFKQSRKWIRFCYKSLNLHENTPKIIGNHPEILVISLNSAVVPTLEKQEGDAHHLYYWTETNPGLIRVLWIQQQAGARVSVNVQMDIFKPVKNVQNVQIIRRGSR